ncbi:protein NIM1-INTERACTING 2-like [Herrania umbratica]|uniref:Protein NIM1-INTERACTING 2-like n=1 Tax=Herrania umbratica TaxID=108875 RepID=A0A6J1BK33_9ROSI|nr:protein NIM1-INTERACTING 2-like [Herrania umbratica]
MESEKRKRGDDGEEEGKRANGGEANVTEEEEEEMEEFFAILKRIHVAVKYFEKANRGGRTLRGEGDWRPSFLLEDFGGDHDVKNERKREDSAEDSGLDLNLEPAS